MALLCPVFWFVLFSHQKRLFWKQLGRWWWQQIGQKELIKSGKILFYIHKQQPKTQQLKQEWFMATVLLIYRSCFWLLSLLFDFFIYLFWQCLFENTLENYRDFCWSNREASADRMLCCRVCLIRPHTQWDLHADAGHVGVYYTHHGK